MKQFVLRLSLSTDNLGPFNIHVESEIHPAQYTNISREQLIAGFILVIDETEYPEEFWVVIESLQENCQNKFIRKKFINPSLNDLDIFGQYPTSSVTPTITPSITVTPMVTPSISITPSVTTTPGLSPTLTPTPTVTTSITPTPSKEMVPSSKPTPSPSSPETQVLRTMYVKFNIL